MSMSAFNCVHRALQPLKQLDKLQQSSFARVNDAVMQVYGVASSHLIVETGAAMWAWGRHAHGGPPTRASTSWYTRFMPWPEGGANTRRELFGRGFA